MRSEPPRQSLARHHYHHPTPKLNLHCPHCPSLPRLNGECLASQCVCSPAWTGANCSSLNLLPAKLRNGYGNLTSPTTSWGAGVVHDAASGQWLMFNDEMAEGCGMGTWGQNSRCVLSTADSPLGPYARQRVVVSSWCHGSSLARDPISGTLVLNHMANSAPRVNCTQCGGSGGVTPPGAPSGPCSQAPGAAPYTQAALVADGASGPFRPAPALLNGGNCETAFAPNGSVYVACPYGGKGTLPNCPQTALLTLSTAPSLDAALAGAWTTLPLSFEPAVCVNWEDQNIWVDSRGRLHALMHAFRGQNTSYPLPGCWDSGGGFLPAGCSTLGGHLYSETGAHWHVSPVPAYTAQVEYEDGSVVDFRARERPHLVTSAAGDPLYFISAVGNPGPGGNTGAAGADHAFTLVQQLGTA